MKNFLKFFIPLFVISCNSNDKEISNRGENKKIEFLCSSQKTLSAFLKQCEFRDFINFVEVKSTDSANNCDSTRKLILKYKNKLAKIYVSHNYYKIESVEGNQYFLFKNASEIQFLGAKKEKENTSVSFLSNDFQYVIAFRKDFIDVKKYEFSIFD